MTTAASWRPILRGEEAKRALDAVRQIAEALAGSSSVVNDRSPHERALFYSYLDRALPNEGYDARASDLLDEAAGMIESVRLSPSLFGGFTGIAWVIDHLFDDDSIDEIDDALCEHVAHTPWTGDYDLISGLVGFGTYALARWPRPTASASLARIVDRLDETALTFAEGTTWLTPPERIIPQKREQYPDGCYNLGVAHGVPGAIALLAEVCARDIAVARARPLLERAVRWLLTKRLPEGEVAFSYYDARGVPPEPARSAWCYGDPGAAVMLYRAASAMGRDDWKREAVGIAHLATRRSFESSQVVDAGLCHGAMGLSQMFQRLAIAEEDDTLARSAYDWANRALQMRRPSEPIAGFPAWMRDKTGAEGWTADQTLLMGAPGVGLALLAAATGIEPAWDRLLLLSCG
jgi:hypothetical protein